MEKGKQVEFMTVEECKQKQCLIWQELKKQQQQINSNRNDIIDLKILIAKADANNKIIQKIFYLMLTTGITFIIGKVLEVLFK